VRALILTALTAMAAALPPSRAAADYPIFYQRYTADPSGLEAGGRLYLYASHDLDGQTSYVMNDITCISTDDLKNWTDHGECFKVSGGSSWATFSWAPAVVQRGGKFYMYYGNGGGSIGVAVADGPAGPFKDPRARALVDGGTPGVNPPAGMWIFDPGVLVDDDGKAYLYFGGNGASNIRVIQLGADMVSTVGSAIALSAPHFFEDSWIHKRDGRYYYSYSTNWDAGAPTIDYMMSSSPTSGFQYAGTVLPQPPQNSNNNHHAIFQYQGRWYIAYHNRTLASLDGVEPVYHRNLGIDRLTYEADGTMARAAITADGLGQLKPLDPYVQVEAETMHRGHGIETEDCGEGGRDVGSIESGDWIEVAGVDFGTGATRFDARVASATSGGKIELRLDGASGTLVGTCVVPGTGGWQTWATVSCDVAGATGVHDLYLVFTGGSGSLLNVNWWRFARGTPPDTTPPSAPTGLAVTGRTATTIALTWAASTDDVGVTGYAVSRRLDSGGVVLASTAGGTSAALSGLAPATTYVLSVTARDAAGNVSQPSSAVTVTTQEDGGTSGGGTSGGAASSGATGGRVTASGCSTAPWGAGASWPVLLVFAAVALRPRAPRLTRR
jgi:arabinoxylan arabinofuranohydrolase